MGKGAQVGTFSGTIVQFNQFLAKRQQLGDTYLHSEIKEPRLFYFAMNTTLNLDTPITAKDINPEGEVKLENDTSA